MDRPRLNSPTTAYHEAGHAVAFWYHAVPFRYVTLRPRTRGNAGHVYVGGHLRIQAEDKPRIKMQLAAAGEIAYARHSRLRPVPDDATLLRRFRKAAENLEDPWLEVDMRHFAEAGTEMDTALQESTPGAVTGPETWLGVWRDTERLIRGELWPAVYAVTWELVFSRRGFTYAEVAAIAEAALETHSAGRREQDHGRYSR